MAGNAGRTNTAVLLYAPLQNNMMWLLELQLRIYILNHFCIIYDSALIFKGGVDQEVYFYLASQFYSHCWGQAFTNTCWCKIFFNPVLNLTQSVTYKNPPTYFSFTFNSNKTKWTWRLYFFSHVSELGWWW